MTAMASQQATATSPFYRALTEPPATRVFGRRSVLVEDRRPVSDEPADVAASPEVEREQAIRAADAYMRAVRRRYRDWVAAGAPGFDPYEASDANYECAHGALPHDRRQVCRCWADDPSRTSPIPTEEEMMEAVPAESTMVERPPTEPSEEPAPPVRRRKDGRIDKRYARRSTNSSRSARKPAPSRSPAVRSAPVAAPESPTVAKMLRELDAELEALHRARAALLEAA